MKSILTPVDKNVLLLTGLSVAMPVTDAAIQKITDESRITALIISNQEMEDIMKIVRSLKESGLLTKRISETIKMKQNNKKEGFFHEH